jgi:hypothetical protein
MRHARPRHNHTRRSVIAAAKSGDEFFAPSGASIDAKLLRELVDGVHGESRRGIRIRNLKIVGDVDLSHTKWSGVLELVNCIVEGDVLLSYAELRGNVDLRGTTLQTLDIRYLDLKGRLAGVGLTAQRGIRGLAASITGGLSLHNAVLTAPPEDENKGLAALDMYRSSIGDIFLNGATLRGGLYAIGASVTRTVRLQKAHFWSRKELGLEAGLDAGGGIALAGARVGGSIYLCNPDGSGELEIHGSVSLNGTESTTLFASSHQLRTLRLDLNGFTYSRLDPATGEDLLDALNTAESSPDRGYTQLADFASQAGAAHLRRRALMAQQRRLADLHPGWSRDRIRRRALGLFVGYGYAPGRSLYWLSAVLVATVLTLKSSGFTQGAEDASAAPSWSQAVVLAIDHLLPFAALDAKAEWTFLPDGTWEWAWFGTFVLLKLAAWILAALAVASATGLIRRT